MLRWNLNHPLTACLAPQMAKGPKRKEIGTRDVHNRRRFREVGRRKVEQRREFPRQPGDTIPRISVADVDGISTGRLRREFETRIRRSISSNERPVRDSRALKTLGAGRPGIQITLLITGKRSRRFHKLVPRVPRCSLRGSVRSPSRSCTLLREPIECPF